MSSLGPSLLLIFCRWQYILLHGTRRTRLWILDSMHIFADHTCSSQAKTCWPAELCKFGRQKKWSGKNPTSPTACYGLEVHWRGLVDSTDTSIAGLMCSWGCQS